MPGGARFPSPARSGDPAQAHLVEVPEEAGRVLVHPVRAGPLELVLAVPAREHADPERPGRRAASRSHTLLARIPDLLREIEGIGVRRGVLIGTFGHAGDGNMHVRVQKAPDWSVEQWRANVPPILDELYKLTARLGGTVSGEHGIGLAKKDYLARQNIYAMMRRPRIKRLEEQSGFSLKGSIFRFKARAHRAINRILRG